MMLTNSQYEQLMSKYYDRQLKTKDIMEQRYQEVVRAVPEFKILDQKIRDLSLAHARSRLTKQADGQDLASAISEISSEKEKLLVSHGFSAEYLKPVYTCPDCQDTGYINNKKCHCFEKEIVNFLYEQSNLKDILEQENFSHFNLEYYPDDYTEEATGLTPRDNIRGVLSAVKSFISSFSARDEKLFSARDEKLFSTEPGNLLLYGNTGVGKTFLTNCIAKELLDRSYTVVYLTSVKLFDILETNKFDRDITRTEKEASLSYILSSDLLIIDDLGTELNNSFTSSQLYNCIDTRLTGRRSTIISTNLSFDDLREHYSERIFSRLTSNYSLLKITGDDIRLKKAIMHH